MICWSFSILLQYKYAICQHKGKPIGLALAPVPPFVGQGDWYFCSEINIWSVNCARATALIYDTRTMFLWTCRCFWDRKISTWGVLEPPNLRIYAECSNHLRYQGQTFPDIFLVKLTFEMLTARATTFIFDSRTDGFLKMSTFWDRKCIHTWGGLESLTLQFMLNAYELPGSDMLCLLFFNTGSGGMSWNDIHHELRNERGVSGANWMNWENTSYRMSTPFADKYMYACDNQSRAPCAVNPMR